MKILFVRHGQTDWNIEKRAQGHNDIELNKTGIEQAYEVKEQLKNIKIDRIYASPLKRALKTAVIINEAHNVELCVENALIERNFGQIEGTCFEGNQWYECWNYDLNTKYEMGGECVQDFFKRIHDFLDNLSEKSSDETVLIVSHGGVGIGVDAYFNGIVYGEDIPELRMKNCEVVEYNL